MAQTGLGLYYPLNERKRITFTLADPFEKMTKSWFVPCVLVEAPNQKVFTFTGHRCGLLVWPMERLLHIHGKNVVLQHIVFELTDLLSVCACVTHHENIFHHRHTQLGGCFIFFTSTWGNDPIWTFAYFSVGLVQPPPSQGEIDPGDRSADQVQQA